MEIDMLDSHWLLKFAVNFKKKELSIKQAHAIKNANPPTPHPPTNPHKAFIRDYFLTKTWRDVSQWQKIIFIQKYVQVAPFFRKELIIL